MALPASYNTVEVRGHYVDVTGAPVAGRVTFTPTPVAMQALADLTTVVGRSITIELDGSGRFAIRLPATDDPDITPFDFTYTVVEKFTGLTGRTFSMHVPVAMADDGIDLSAAAPVVSAPGNVRPYRLSDLGDLDLTGALTGAILRKQLDGTWKAVSLPFVTVEQVAGLVPQERLAALPELLISGEITRDADGAALAAPVVWPDGTPGQYEATAVSETHPGAVDSYSVTYGDERTYVQPTVTRNSDGAVTFRPSIVVT